MQRIRAAEDKNPGLQILSRTPSSTPSGLILEDAASRVSSSLRVWFRWRVAASLLQRPERKDQLCSRAGL